MIQILDGEYKEFKFPCGEVNIQVISAPSYVNVNFEFEENEEILTLIMLCDAVRRLGKTLWGLRMPYIPFARQDRVCNLGEAFSLKVFSKLINDLKFKRVFVTDPHSIVSTALINNVVEETQHAIFYKYLEGRSEYYIISPDGGSLKKAYTFSSSPRCLDIIECSKKRNLQTGEIEKTMVYKEDFNGKDCYIIDDICDGGRTFIEIAKILKQRNCGKITLFVSHGFFTKGLEVFDNLIDEIYTRKGKIK